ncbi:MAG: DUF3516 domain-containing protein [Thermoanaerobaculia bacterium]|nr:DUF3516 domain-containing protein [Thermoanaerobaculia bacterium]
MPNGPATSDPTSSSSGPTPETDSRADSRSLLARVPEGGTRDVDEIFDRFLSWTVDRGFVLYPAQEEALLEIMAGRHVILNTPTGSGKSMVALGMHFKALCEGKTCFYTSPIKALASEKFFDLCDILGPENVGMQTGDASINPDASVVCATAEVLANRALRQGSNVGADYIVMDEFHYYGDSERGWAWQVPLITLPGSTFLLMSATLGNTAPISERIEKFTGREVSLVYSVDRPVPLEFEYRKTPLQETVEYLLESKKAPIYVVNFTQRECAELAQSLTSVNPCTKEERQKIRGLLQDVHWDTPYGKDMRRFLSFGIGVHHAGLLPKYRLLVEQLAQQGLLKIICGTDTLGVGVNIPIRTVLFTKLSKYDGTKVGILSVRDFQQIAGRAGRKGFDDIGYVVCQAPEHVVAARKAEKKGRHKRAAKKRKAPKGFVEWTDDTFQSLIRKPPETLGSQFRVTHGMVLDLLQRDAELDMPERDNFASLREIIDRCHDRDHTKAKHLRHSAMLVLSLYRAGILEMKKDAQTAYYWAVVDPDLQWDFSLFHLLSLYLVEALDVLDPEGENYHLDVVSLTEAILENPRVVLFKQEDKLKGDLIAKLKAEGVPYERRMEELEKVSYEKPLQKFIEETFETFHRQHPWVRGEDIRPKSIGRAMFEGYFSFNQYVRDYGLQRSEGVLLRYLSQLYKTLTHTVPEVAKTEAVYDVLGYFRTMIEHIDTSLLEEWESMLHPDLQLDEEAQEQMRREMRAYELFHDPKAFRARVRAELHQLVRCLAEGDWEQATTSIRQGTEGAENHWTDERFQEALAPYLQEYGEIVFDHRARQAQHTRLEKTGPRQWSFHQNLLDPEDDCFWYLSGDIDLSDDKLFEGNLLQLRYLGT